MKTKGQYHKLILSMMNIGLCTEANVIEINSIIDKCVMEPLREKDEEYYWHVMRRIYETCSGNHYDEHFAMWEVSQMHHTDKQGMKHSGEHWTIEQITEVYNQNRMSFKPTDTVWDVYVALHSWWHDNICQDITDFGDKAESKNIERAINYFFRDEDAPEGKIWNYYKGMRTNKTV